MSDRFVVTLAAAISVAVAAGLLLADGTPQPGFDPASVQPAALQHLAPAAVSIPAWEERVATRPADGLDREGLGRLYLRHGHEAGDDGAFVTAESAFRGALHRIPGHIDARLGLARALAAQHRFDEARATALAVWTDDPSRLDALAIVADAALETGDYDDARDLIATLAAGSDAPAALARVALLREIEGRDEEAIALLERGARAARDAHALGDRMSWYLMRLADLHLKAGRIEIAAAHADMAVAAWPDGLGAQLVLARTRAAAGQLDEAIALYETLVERMPHPEVMAALGDLHQARGEHRLAADIRSAVLAAGDAAGAGEDRPMARFLADHGLRPDEAVLRARRDLEARSDIHAWDTVAWAELAAGNVDAASVAIGRALATGTRDPQVRYHAGMIAAARGDHARAIELLESVLARSPRFDPIQAPRARAELDRLRAAG